jgi:hypothetical protein
MPYHHVLFYEPECRWIQIVCNQSIKLSRYYRSLMQQFSSGIRNVIYVILLISFIAFLNNEILDMQLRLVRLFIRFTNKNLFKVKFINLYRLIELILSKLNLDWIHVPKIITKMKQMVKVLFDEKWDMGM